MKIVELNVSELINYDNNPRDNERAVKPVADSIKEFGFKVPIIVDKNNVIVAGHTRLAAAKLLELKKVPCIIADDLTEEQITAFRLADNRVAEFAEWNFDKLEEELAKITDINMTDFGFKNLEEIDWADVEDLSEDTYETPKKDMLECPNCHHVDSKNHFKKVESDENIS